MSCSEIFFSRMAFTSVLWVATKKNCHQTGWGLSANTSLISQFWENVFSFNFLANALTHQSIGCIWCYKYTLNVLSVLVDTMTTSRLSEGSKLWSPEENINSWAKFKKRNMINRNVQVIFSLTVELKVTWFRSKVNLLFIFFCII